MRDTRPPNRLRMQGLEPPPYKTEHIQLLFPAPPSIPKQTLFVVIDESN